MRYNIDMIMSTTSFTNSSPVGPHVLPAFSFVSLCKLCNLFHNEQQLLLASFSSGLSDSVVTETAGFFFMTDQYWGLYTFTMVATKQCNIAPLKSTLGGVFLNHFFYNFIPVARLGPPLSTCMGTTGLKSDGAQDKIKSRNGISAGPLHDVRFKPSK